MKRSGESPVLRNATRSDVPEVLRLVRALAEYERLSHEVTATEADFACALFGAVPRAHAVLAWIGARPVGLALWYYTFSTFTARPNMFLEDLFVEPEYRGRGIGLKLIRYLARCAHDGGCRRVEWRVLNWNQPAMDFYRRIGARPVGNWTVQLLDGAALLALADGGE